MTQYHFTLWPDHGVPEYAGPILNYLRRIKAQCKQNKGPILVHCRYAIFYSEKDFQCVYCLLIGLATLLWWETFEYNIITKIALIIMIIWYQIYGLSFVNYFWSVRSIIMALSQTTKLQDFLLL